jgi:hypothetical protein
MLPRLRVALMKGEQLSKRDPAEIRFRKTEIVASDRPVVQPPFMASQALGGSGASFSSTVFGSGSVP